MCLLLPSPPPLISYYVAGTVQNALHASFHLISTMPLWNRMMAQMVKNPPAMQETQVWSLGWEDPLKKGMATHSSILARRTPWTEEPSRLQSMGLQRVRHDWATNTFNYICIFSMKKFGLTHFISVHTKTHISLFFTFICEFSFFLSNILYTLYIYYIFIL